MSDIANEIRQAWGHIFRHRLARYCCNCLRHNRNHKGVPTDKRYPAIKVAKGYGGVQGAQQISVTVTWDKDLSSVPLRVAGRTVSQQALSNQLANAVAAAIPPLYQEILARAIQVEEENIKALGPKAKEVARIILQETQQVKGKSDG